MNCIVRHKDADLSFKMKCVAVESERVFGDLIVTQQNPRFVPQASIYPKDALPAFRNKTRNLAHEVLEAPDFMAMNRRRVLRHQRSVPIPDAIDRPSVLRRLKSADGSPDANGDCNDLGSENPPKKERKTYPAPLLRVHRDQEAVVSSLVDKLLLDIYGLPGRDRSRSESESTVSSPRLPPQHRYLQRKRLLAKNTPELQVLVETLSEHVNHAGGLLIRQLRRRDRNIAKRDKQYDVITAHLQALSEKRSEDTKMRFSVAPQPGESGFTQWLDAMKMVARLPGGIPPEFRKRLWLTLSERHLQQRGVDWRQAEKLCFNEWSNPDDEELGIQIVKDLHRTGCSLFCGAAGRDNQAVLRRVLLGFARWNKSVGYCQGLNVLAALVLQVMDRAEAASVKVMIYLIEGVLPEGYFADNLRGLSVDMAVFRDLLRMRLPKLSRHLETLQSDAKDKATGSSYEPPLTNVFTMQWFLTLFCHCLPQEAVLRVWDLIFLEGDEVLLRTALAIWEGLADRIMTVTSADEFYSIMGVLTREMLEFTDTNNLIKAIVSTGPLIGVTALREKHRYNITPWARRLSDDDETETEEDERLAVAAAMFGMSHRSRRERETSSSSSLQTVAASNDRDRLALDISTLKQQYAKLRERQRQAHIILSAACARQSLVPSATSQAMNHLLVGKSALVSGKARQLGPLHGAVSPRARLGPPHSPKNPNRKDRQGVTLHWKDTKRRKENKDDTPGEGPSCGNDAESTSEGMSVVTSTSPRLSAGANADSDSDSTSTELCDEPDRLSDVDSEELTSNSDCYVMATDDEKSPRREGTDNKTSPSHHDSAYGQQKGAQSLKLPSNLEETSISEITDQIRRLSTDNERLGRYKLADEAPDQVERESLDSVKTDDVPVFATDIDSINSSSVERVERPSETLGSFDFSSTISGGPNAGESSSVSVENETEVQILDEYQFTDHSLFPLKVLSSSHLVSSDDPEVLEFDKKVAADTSARIDRPDMGKRYDFAPELKYSNFDDDNLVAVDSEARHSETEPDFGKGASTVQLASSPGMIGDNLNKVVADSKPYSRSYVIGHVPISPINLEQKLNYLAEYSSSTAAIKVVERETQEFPMKIHEPQNKSNGVFVNISSVDFTRNNDLVRIKPATSPAAVVGVRLELSQSPKTPGSDKSCSSGETMGPDSKTSSLTTSPRTPVSFDSRDFHAEKSAASSVSSESKTLTLRSIGSDDQDVQLKAAMRITSLAKSSSPSLISFDSLKGKSSLSPKLEASSSSDSCSPDRKKSSERSFSSDLQSPISANSIKFTSNCKGGRGTYSDSPINLCSATSPFYPIARPNEKTPSPYSTAKQKNSTTDSEETSPEQKSTSSKGSGKLIASESRKDRVIRSEEGMDFTGSSKDDFRHNLGKDRSQKTDIESSLADDKCKMEETDTTRFYGINYSQSYRTESQLEENESRDQYADKDTVSPLPREKFEKLAIFYDKSSRSLLERNKDRTNEYEVGQDCSKPFERSSSSLDKRFTDSKLSSSSDEFGRNSLKKRSSDILEDLRHLEIKSTGDGGSENGITKKASYILQDLKSLEARRQDTFSDSANGFSKVRLIDLEMNIPTVSRKQYVIEPKIQIQEHSDSFLNTLARVSENTKTDDDKEPKLGVWTKVKPRKKSDNGRRSSDRALKIIQENSAILHRILTCQAKKRLPDLEEISKEITISPINEEISKIFSPILEKIGLNEHEINEELARINFKDLDQLSMTSGSEFDAKINDELSKLSLIDDTEEIDNLDLDEALSRDYLDTREALIDRQINEELSKLLANYEERPSSSAGLPRQEQGSSSQNISEMEGLDLSSISTNVFSHKSSNDSIDTKSELGSIQEGVIKPEKSYDYNDKPIPYPPPKYNLQDLSPKSDIDIYRELEKLDKISAGEIYPSVQPVSSAPEVISTNPYAPDHALTYGERMSPILSYTPKAEKSFDLSPLRSPYDSYKPYDFKSRISPRKTPGNPYSVRSYEKPSMDSSFELSDHKSVASSHIYDISPKRAVISKETLEFRVRYDDEPPPKIRSDDFTLRSFQTDIANLDKGAAYYETNTADPAKYLPRDERGSSEKDIGESTVDYAYNKSDLCHRKYQDVSSQEYSYHKTSDYNRSSSYTLPSSIREDEIGTHLTVHRRESHSLSPSHQFSTRKLPVPVNPYLSKLSPSLEDVTKRPVSHPEFLDKMNVAKYADHSSQGSNNYRKSSLSLGNIGHASRGATHSLEKTPSPKIQFSPFPVRNTARKPRELGLKLGLYSPVSPEGGQVKRSH
ncbi:uncharacterized protein LOC124302108 isoform X2 [Neodiprion virginianus]|uniref:uncharacterized protein LOC124302108 isoform X2 n=1 Tax=Neodiprion virginianus TaxID=2961670 RepID=UPI001EE6E891|nr:uncharacterized protein LOC124302108 isoform X2 [Neodiprion virginianus]